MSIECRRTPIGEGFGYDNNACPMHGPTAPRYFVDHGTIHDRVTGKHVELVEAAELLSVEPEALQRIAWGVVVKLGAALKNAEAERDRLRDAIPCSACGDSTWQVHHCIECSEARLRVALARIADLERERGEAVRIGLDGVDHSMREFARLIGERSKAIDERNAAQDQLLEVERERDSLRSALEAMKAERDAWAATHKEMTSTVTREVAQEFWAQCVERDTAERIAQWLDERARSGSFTPLTQSNITSLADELLSGAWKRGQDE